MKGHTARLHFTSRWVGSVQLGRKLYLLRFLESEKTYSGSRIYMLVWFVAPKFQGVS